MPELPDVETFRSYLDSTALHQRIKKVEVNSADMLTGISARSLQSKLKHHEFKSTHRRGKNLFVELTGRSEWLLLHFGMTGFLAYYKEPDQAPAHARVVFHFTNGCQLAYDNMRKIGKVSLIDDIEHYLRKKNIGPDALELAETDFYKQLKERKGDIKGMLMNQEVLAGIGNVYADELLFHSRTHPKARVEELKQRSLKKIYRAMQSVLKKAITCHADINRFPRTWMLPHRNRNGKCPRCAHEWKRIKVSGRTTYFCPHCQKL